MTARRPAEDPSVARVRRALLRRGVPRDEIDQALADGRIELLAIETAVLPAPERYTVVELAERSAIDADLARRLWRALGFPSVGDDEAVFSDADLVAVVTLRRLLDRNLAEAEATVQFARVLGSSLARMAEALIGTQLGGHRTPQERVAYAEAVLVRDSLLDQTAELIEYTWRRHLRVAARRQRELVHGDPAHPLVTLAIAFADMVGYTALSQQLSEDALAAVVDRFEELAYDVVVARGGRIVKMIGDEVMYAADEPSTAVDIALALADAYEHDDLLSEVRIGVAYGPVLAREGDYFGAVVNLASRLVNVAYPGTVVVSQSVHDGLADDPALAWSSLRHRYLKDIGTVPLWAVYRAGDEQPREVGRRRYGRLRMFLSEATLARAERRAAEVASETADALEAALDAVAARRPVARQPPATPGRRPLAKPGRKPPARPPADTPADSSAEPRPDADG